MATLAILKSLHTLDNRQFIKGLSDSQRRSRKAGAAIGRQARNMSRRFQTLTGNVFSLRSAIGVLAGSAGIGLLVRNQMQAIDTTAKFARMIGASTEEIVGLQHAAEITAGVADKEFRMAFQRMTRRVAEAAQGTGEAKAAIKELGLEAEDLAKAGPAEAFKSIADAIQDVEDPAQRVRIAFKLFDSEGAALVNTLGAGRGEIERLIQQSDDLGRSFDAIEAQKVEAANDAITEMKGAFSGMGRIVTVELAGPIQSVADSMNEALTGSTEVQDAVREMTRASVGGIATMLDAAASVMDFVEQNSTMAQFGLIGYIVYGRKGAVVGSLIGSLFDHIERRMAALGIGVSDNVAELIRLGDRVERLQGQLESLPEGGRDFRRIERELREARGELERVQEAAKPDELLEYAAAWDENEEAVGGLSSGLRTLAETMRASLEEGEKLAELDMGRITGMTPPDDALRGGGAGAAEITQEELDKQKARLDVIREGMATEMELEQAHFEREQEFLATAHETLFESEAERKMMLENLERDHQDRMFQIQTQGLGRLFQSQMRFLDQMEAADKASGAVQVGIMTNAFASITAAGAQHNKEMFKMNKAAGIANAVVSTLVAANKTWEQWGYPWGIPMVAAQLAAGYANVQAIRSTSFSGGGGAAPSTSAGGGVPAVQDVSGQGQGQQQQAQNVTIEIAGGDDRLLSKRQLRRLMEDMQEELGDDASIGQLRIA